MPRRPEPHMTTNGHITAKDDATKDGIRFKVVDSKSRLVNVSLVSMGLKTEKRRYVHTCVTCHDLALVHKPICAHVHDERCVQHV